MKLAMILFFTFALVFFHNVKAAPTPATPPAATPIQLWNHILAVSYGYGLQCSQRNRFKHPLPPNKPFFTVHGLLPNVPPPPQQGRKQPRPSTSITKCYPSLLSAGDVQSVRGELVSNRPNLFDINDQNAAFSFWGDEWQKHGTCSKFSKLEYFQETLSLFKKLQLRTIVKHGGDTLVPDDNKLYTKNDVLHAFEMHKPYLMCAGIKGNIVLTELYFCLDSQAK